MALFNPGYLKEKSKRNLYGNLENKENIPYFSIYCLKAMGAFFIICIHCYAPWPIFPIIRTAVPFFFMISGFFLYRDDRNQSITTCIKSFRKIFWLTLYANIFYYLCFYVPNDLFPFTSTKNLIKCIFFGNKLGFHLWYLNAYLETLIIVIIFQSLNKLNFLWFIIPVFVIWGLLTGKYQFLLPCFPNDLLVSRNFLTMGIPCFGIGWLIKKYHIRILSIIRYPILFTTFLLILSEFEISLLRYSDNFIGGDYIISTYPLAASILITCIKFPLFGKRSIMEYVGKNWATYIYIFHILVLNLFSRLNSKYLELPAFTTPFIVFSVTIFFIIVWQKSSEKSFK